MPVPVHFPKQIRVSAESAESIAINWKSFLAQPNSSNRNLGIEHYLTGSDTAIYLFGHHSTQSLGKYFFNTLTLMTGKISVVEV